jgi:hypothetical protein
MRRIEFLTTPSTSDGATPLRRCPSVASRQAAAFVEKREWRRATDQRIDRHQVKVVMVLERCRHDALLVALAVNADYVCDKNITRGPMALDKKANTGIRLPPLSMKPVSLCR